MDWIDPSSDLAAEFAFLRGMLATSGGWTRSALAIAACDSPWFAAQVADLAPPPAPNPTLALAAGVVVSLPLFGPLAANAGEWGGVLVRQVLGHTSIDGEVFDFRDGEAVWSDTGKAVSRTQIRALDRGTRQEFYASMGLATSVGPDPETTTLAAAPAQPAAERIRVFRDGREAPVLASVRERVAALRAQRQAEYLALVGPGTVGSDNAAAVGTEVGSGWASDEVVAAATLFDQVWAQVARERAAAKTRGEALQPALTQATGQPPSLFQQIWAEVQAERAAARGDGVIGTMASGAGAEPGPGAPRADDDTPAIGTAHSVGTAPGLGTAPDSGSPAAIDTADAPREPEMADAPAVPDLAGDAPTADIADIPPDRDLIDASAAFIDPRG